MSAWAGFEQLLGDANSICGGAVIERFMMASRNGSEVADEDCDGGVRIERVAWRDWWNPTSACCTA